MRTIEQSLAAFHPQDLLIFKNMVNAIELSTIADLKIEKIRQNIVKELPKYNGRAIQTFENIINTLHLDGRDIPEALLFIDNGFMTAEMKEKANKIHALRPKCPNCEYGLTLIKIYHENENGFNSMWRCKNCQEYERGSARTFEAIMEEYDEKVKKIMES